MLILNKQFINNEWQDSASTETLAVYSPYTEEKIANLACGHSKDVDKAVEAAQNALQSWKHLSGSARGEYLIKIAAELKKHEKELIDLNTQYSGKLLFESKIDLDNAIKCYEYYAEVAKGLDDEQWKIRDVGSDDIKAKVYHEPLGVVALITPWNFPLITAAWKLAPALAAGCTIVWKPSEFIPLPEQKMGDIAVSIGLPKGVLNIVHGDGYLGAALTSHPKVNKISFTGSNVVGEKVMQAASIGVRPVTLELGGKSPIIVLEDADVEKASEWIWTGIYYNTGQMCSATSRMLVHEAIAKDIYQALHEKAEQIVVGNPNKPGNELGVSLAPVISQKQYDTITAYQESARSAGLKDLFSDIEISLPSQGYYVKPAVYLDVPDSHKVWQEEIFGPVLSVQEFSDINKAIAIANQGDFGLAATVIGSDEDKAEAVARQLESGITWVNGHQTVPPGGSWGGFKKSGFGRELGPWGLRSYQSVKHIYILK